MSVHTVTITDAEDLEYTIDVCPGGECTLWNECKTCEARSISDEEDDAGEYTAHGEGHQRIDDVWMTESGSCALASTDSGAQGMCNIAAEAGVGTHQVECGYWGDGHWDADLIQPAPQEHHALAVPKGIDLVQATHDRTNGPSEKAGPSSAMAERGRRGGESSDRVVGAGDGGRGRPDPE